MRGRFFSFARATAPFVALAIVCGGAACTSFGTETTPEVDGGSSGPGDASVKPPPPNEADPPPSTFRNDPSLGPGAFVAVTTGTSVCKYNPGSAPYCTGPTQASHTCALRNDGAVLCWGADKSGRLGTVPQGDSLESVWRGSPTPTKVPGLPAPATAIRRRGRPHMRPPEQRGRLLLGVQLERSARAWRRDRRAGRRRDRSAPRPPRPHEYCADQDRGRGAGAHVRALRVG
jgi:hypothetical protein